MEGLRGLPLLALIALGALALFVVFCVLFLIAQGVMRRIEKWDIQIRKEQRETWRRLCEQDDADTEARRAEDAARHVEKEEWPRHLKN